MKDNDKLCTGWKCHKVEENCSVNKCDRRRDHILEVQQGLFASKKFNVCNEHLKEWMEHKLDLIVIEPKPVKQKF